jgi:spermidine synthase
MSFLSSRMILVLSMFFLSGASGLIYQIVWVRMLSRLLGNTVFATSTVLAAFMAGLAIGAYAFGRFIDKKDKPLKVYAQLEIAVGIFALILPLILNNLFPVYELVYQALGSGSTVGITVIQVAIAFVCLLVPTIAMGATLPVLGAVVSSQASRFGTNISLLYGVNTLGAVVGTLASGFFLIGVFGEWATVIIGVSVNLLVGLMAYYYSNMHEGNTAPSIEPSDVQSSSDEGRVSPYPSYVRYVVVSVFMVSGFVALGYEIVWTRLLQIFTGPSIYAFTLMLGVYLSGIAIGSIGISRVIDRFKEPLLAFGILELILSFLGVIGLFWFQSVAEMAIDSYSLRMLLPTLLVVLPPTIILGLIFPTVTKCYTMSIDRAGSSISHVYTLNTIGSIFGSLAVGFWLMPAIGSMATICLLAGINGILGLVIIFMVPKRSMSYATYGLSGGLALAILLSISVAPDPSDEVVEYQISRLAQGNPYEIYYNKEDITSMVTSFGITHDTEEDPGKSLWVNGYGMTVLTTDTKVLAHVPIWMARKPENMLVVCFGMGTTFKSATTYDDLNVTSVELIPNVYECYPYYHESVGELSQYDSQWVVNDGRNHLLLSQAKYDVITIDPPPPIYGAGTVNLYTQEFYELCKRRLSETGVLSQWFPGETPLVELKMLIKTYQSVFPNAMMWRGPEESGCFIVASREPIDIDAQVLVDAWKNSDVVTDLTEWKKWISSPEEITDLFLMGPAQIEALVGDAPILTDNNPYTEFPLTLHWLYGRSPMLMNAWDQVESYREPITPFLINAEAFIQPEAGIEN